MDSVRVDKWIWAARLTKTRALAVEAIKGGRVEVNGAPIKPSRDLRVGDRLEMSFGPVRRVLVVRGLSERRVGAPEAAKLYEETPESIAARERHAAEQRLIRAAGPDWAAGRPTKRDRRKWEKETKEARRRAG